MRWLLYIAILASLFLAPLERTDVAKLLPIKAVAVYMDTDSVVLETDTQHKGMGADVTEALQDLKKNTPAVVYLDTAEYLLIDENATDFLAEFKTFLKPSVKVCVCDASGRAGKVAKYLEVHGNLPKLRDWKSDENPM